ncbi:MAG: transposase [Candidatus Omnitrophica bacterium]|nr:transposase [Candidatus Omnitrophota bacterium]
MRRKKTLAVGEVYHVFNKSIADYKIFNSEIEYLRMRDMIRYYQIENMPLRFSWFSEQVKVKEDGFNKHFTSVSQGKEKLVQIIAYCLMPTHLHLILKQLQEKGVSIFMGNTLNSYSRYFNTKHKRRGPLWEGRFKNVLIKTDEQLLHLTRYIHLNPVTAYLVDNPQEWVMSSYKEYLLNTNGHNKICKYNDILEIEPTSYRGFVEDRISYQRELAKIKELLLEA